MVLCEEMLDQNNSLYNKKMELILKLLRLEKNNVENQKCIKGFEEQVKDWKSKFQNEEDQQELSKKSKHSKDLCKFYC